ncbi:antitoxin [Nocardioides daeguensis]|uniref:antitoxin n=1 Tax=Nocardioides daeguensis TaxID=908359 RepID=UPI001C486824|nr:antitoxin [Nocardioides daeguensis]MBV6726054.1 antitoxin [Nocardioides daeguensis]MCR1771897.1 antitoxin [Nocardioides daeguensis]
MGFLDDAKDKLTDAVNSQGDKIGDALDKAADLASDKTGGKFDAKLELGAEKAKDALDSLDGKNDDIS